MTEISTVGPFRMRLSAHSRALWIAEILSFRGVNKAVLCLCGELCSFLGLRACRAESTMNARSAHSRNGNFLADAAFETHAQELLRFHGKFHRQLAKYLLAEAIDDQSDGVFG